MEKETQKTVLIVDDEADVVRYLEMALDDAGFSTVTASGGDEALARVREKAPDLISLDIVMPKGSGVKFFRELQKNPAWSKIPVIVVTGHARDELGRTDFQEMTLSGPGVYLEKPVTAEKYVNAVKKVLGMAPGPAGGLSKMQEEAKTILETLDEKTLKDVLKLIKSKKQG
jgi:CheY-like chemotaxis protein